ncbi:MAG: helix-turn-helix transcriptional regulator [Armatimonadetes bacterium]|nr:helix-turn-helix transcriptional regulator [Armatimonadota bacterium]
MSKNLTLVTGRFSRPVMGHQWTPKGQVPGGYNFSGKPAWQGNGGGSAGHPARSLPFTLEMQVPTDVGQLVAVELVGVFALYADPANETAGTRGAALQFLRSGRILLRQNLVNQRHYGDAYDLDLSLPPSGDGITLKRLGIADIAGERARVDLLRIELPERMQVDEFRLKDLGASSSFVIYDAFFELEAVGACPFHPKSKGISLSELASIVRLGDSVKFGAAISQFADSIELAETLDEARGQALTFLAVITSSALEIGGGRRYHTLLLEAARALETCRSSSDVAAKSREIIARLDLPVVGHASGPNARLLDRALSIIDRNFARELSDDMVASQLGLSTSHFRHLFRHATGQPFNKYLTALRLEKAKELLLEQAIPVSQVAESVGFSSLAHFSRAFTSRFNVTPTSIRRNASTAHA